MTNRQTSATAQTPASLGFAMPAEWERHEATWLAWPHNPTDWPDKLDTIRWVYTEIVRHVTGGERVRMLIESRTDRKIASRYLARAGVNLDQVEFIVHPTNRGWMRDSGPIFVRKGAAKSAGRGGKSTRAIVNFHFNAWAKYDDYHRDRRVPEAAAKHLGLALFPARQAGRPFILEGGGIDVNGRGTVLTTEECYLDRNVQVRNPGLDREQFEAALKQHLGVANPQWLVAGPVGDDTHGHIDDICRFVNPTTLVLVKETNSKDANYRPLSENWERIQEVRLENGAQPQVVALPMPAPLYFDGDRLPASYANFYISNAAVLVPTFNDPNDRVALGTLAELFTDRPVVGIHAVDLVLGFGTLHCLTQQEPA